MMIPSKGKPPTNTSESTLTPALDYIKGKPGNLKKKLGVTHGRNPSFGRQ
jgi:hypothetical protein